MARYLAAKAEEDDYARNVHDPMFADSPYSNTDERKAVSDEMDRLVGITYELMHELLEAPAPHRAALLWKLEWLLADTDNYCWGEHTIDPIQRDVRRILGGGGNDAPISPAGVSSESRDTLPAPDSQISQEALKSTQNPFQPQSWLDAFEKVGGGWVLREDRFSLITQIDGCPPEDQRTAQWMIAELTAEDRAALIAHLCDREA